MTSPEWVKKQRIERPSQLKRKIEHFEQSITSINQTSKFLWNEFEKGLKWFKNAQLSCFHMMRHISDIASPHVSRSGELSPPPGSSFSRPLQQLPSLHMASVGTCGPPRWTLLLLLLWLLIQGLLPAQGGWTLDGNPVQESLFLIVCPSQANLHTSHSPRMELRWIW